MKPIRVAVIGAGSFGMNHIRVINQLENVELVGIVDTDAAKAPLSTVDPILDRMDAAIVATPTRTHEQIATRLLESGVDVLVEKPIADSSIAGERLARLAEERGRILQVGHLERFNPAILALEQHVTLPLFFEIHRLSVFTPRSLDIDVVLDLMIHDLDIVLNLTKQQPDDIRAAGISVLSSRVDIANVRLSFANGCIANLTASRVSTEKVRKLRLFQPGEYISVDYQRQDAVRVAIRKNEANEMMSPRSSARRRFKEEFVRQNDPPIGFESLKVDRAEPLELELKAFFAAVGDRSRPRVEGFEATRALRLAEAILGKIKEHADLVQETLRLANLRIP